MLLNNSTSKTASNCDVFHEMGFSTDGVFEIFTGDSLVQAYCEFDREGHNWMVSEHLAKQDLKKLKLYLLYSTCNSTSDKNNNHFLLRISKL